jgi:hypothetical protein
MQNKLKIAIVIPGHIRWWLDCKENFLQNFYDTNHDIDVFVDTYNSVFRSDKFEEQKKKQFLSVEEIKNLFSGINVVSIDIQSDGKNTCQEAKLISIHEKLCSYEKKYDLIVRTRFDITLDTKINYLSIYDQCIKNPKLIFIGQGGSDGLLNDMFAVCLPETFNIYVNRFKYGDVQPPEGLLHGSLKRIKEIHGIVYNTETWIYLKRINGQIQKMGI